VLEEVEKEVVLVEPTIGTSMGGGGVVAPTPVLPAAPAAPSGGAPQVIKTINKHVVELLCSQHNPVSSPSYASRSSF